MNVLCRTLRRTPLITVLRRTLRRTPLIIALLLATSALCVESPAPFLGPDSLAAQPPTPPARPMLPPPVLGIEERGELRGLMRHKEELELSDEQVERIEEIARRLQERNQPLLERLRKAGVPLDPQERMEVREMDMRERRQLRRTLELEQPTLRRLRENTRMAMEMARRTLTPEQRVRARELMQERVDELRDGGERGPRTGPPPGGRRPGPPRS